jgi:glycine/D-amino acid oxidase-like deaminating enzyme
MKTLNLFIEESVGLQNCYSESEKPMKQGMQDLCGSIFNQHEGSINTGKMMHRLIQLTYEQGISILNGIDVSEFHDKESHVQVDTQYGAITAKHLYICTNGLSKKLLPTLDLQPARAQVLVTSPIEKLKLNSTYHYDSGYYYFRVVDSNRILIGGARNQDFAGETTEKMEVTDNIKNHIVQLLKDVIIPNESFKIDYQWAGIMGVGQEKSPIIENQTPRIHYAVRMGGMGVAMGMAIGERLSALGLR